MRIPLDALEQLADVVPYMPWTAYDLDRLLTVIAVPELLDLDEPEAA